MSDETFLQGGFFSSTFMLGLSCCIEHFTGGATIFKGQRKSPDYALTEKLSTVNNKSLARSCHTTFAIEDALPDRLAFLFDRARLSAEEVTSKEAAGGASLGAFRSDRNEFKATDAAHRLWL
jgi:hypothetical protein